MDNNPNELPLLAPGTESKMHPLIVVSCVSVILFSLIGIANFTGLINTPKQNPIVKPFLQNKTNEVIKNKVTPLIAKHHVAQHKINNETTQN